MTLQERAEKILREINDFKLSYFTVGELHAILRLTAPEPSEEDIRPTAQYPFYCNI